MWMRRPPALAGAAVLALALIGAPPALAAAPATDAAGIEALQRAHAAVVGILVTATPGARSAESLGRQRAGTGVVIGADGLILTIGYLTLEAENIQVVTRDNRTLPARPVGYDLATGFGLVQPLFPLRGIAPVGLASGAAPQPGDPLMAAVGGADGGVALTQLVSRRPFSGYWEYHIDGALFTSPPIGNHSGAPLFNTRGELLGIGSLFVGDTAGEGSGPPGNMFVPVELLKPILAELQQTGTSKASRRPWLGLSSVERDGKVRVLRVNKDSPAEAGGLRPGDVVVAIDGEAVGTLEAFYKKLWARGDPQGEVRLTVEQGGEVREIRVQAVDRLDTLRKPRGI